MSNLVSQNKNLFNKICASLKKVPAFKEGYNVRSIVSIPITDESGWAVNLSVYYTYKNGKVSIKEEGNLVYIIWEPDFNLYKLEFESTYSWHKKDFGDPVANIIYNKYISDDYYVEHCDNFMKKLLDYDEIGITAKELQTYPDKQIEEVITKTKAWHKLNKFYDYLYGYTPTYELKDEIHKRLSNRNSIPIMFWDASKDIISWATETLYGSTLMTKKNRMETSLGYFAEMKPSDFRSNCTYAMRYAPVDKWGLMKYKDPETGKEITSTLRS